MSNWGDNLLPHSRFVQPNQIDDGETSKPNSCIHDRSACFGVWHGQAINNGSCRKRKSDARRPPQYLAVTVQPSKIWEDVDGYVVELSTIVSKRRFSDTNCRNGEELE